MRFSKITLAGALIVALAPAAGFAKPRDCTLILDADSGKTLMRDGDCATQLSPASTFKLALALIGYDAGILKDSTHPVLTFRPGVDSPINDYKMVDPIIWLRESVLWYSRATTRQLGQERFAAYVKKLGYGNADVSGDPGKHNGLSQAWIDSSLKISPDEQAAFMRRIAKCDLPVAKEACEKTKSVMPAFKADIWTIWGKTGTVLYRNDPKGVRTGWFVGWATSRTGKGTLNIVFAATHDHAGNKPLPAGPRVREDFLKKLHSFRL